MIRLGNTRARLVAIIIGLFVFILSGYTLFEARHLLLGATLHISSPQDGFVTHDPLFLVEGRAQNITRISLNDRPIFVNEEGYFTEQLLLQKGYTIIKVRAEDRFGRITEKTLHMVHN